MKQTPIFIPLSSIESIGEAETTPYRCGLMEIVPKGERLQGFRCDCLTAEYYWQSNGAGKGFAQMLHFTFEGRRSHFNFLTRTINNRINRFVVLLPMGDSWLVFGSKQEPPEIIDQKPTHEQEFMMECEYSITPYPYFDDEVIADDCDVVELMEHLFNLILEDKEN